MKTTYNKRIHDRKCDRIRDRIPEIIHAAGKQAQLEVMTEPQYRRALLEKLVEEAQEAAQAGENLAFLDFSGSTGCTLHFTLWLGEMHQQATVLI